MSAKSVKKNKNTALENFSQPDAEAITNNSLKRFIIVFSIAWFGIVAIYITKFFGWENLFSMLPSEFSGFMASITLPLAIVWVIMAYIDRGNSFRRETKILQDSLNQIIFPASDGNAATKLISEAIRSQVMELKEVSRDVCAQSDVIKRDLSDRVTDLRNLAEALDKYSSSAMPNLNDEIKKLVENFNFVAEKSVSATADFRVNTLQMKEDSENLVKILTPMVNEMVTAAQRVKEVVDVNNENISKAQEQLAKYAETSHQAINGMIKSWAERGENLEHTFLRTAENCEDLFRRLDSGISHIESSIAEQKKVVETQAEMLQKNSGYLDNKLGEYGKLISMEVEAMVERSSTLEQNIQSQIKNLKDAAAQVSQIFNGFGEDISYKRQLLGEEGNKVLSTIQSTINGLTTQMQKLTDFYENSQNSEMGRFIAGLSESLSQFTNQSSDIIGKFENVSSDFSNNINKLAQSSQSLSEQSKTNAGLLIEQDEYINKALANLKQISAQIYQLNTDLSSAGNKISNTLGAYQNSFTDLEQNVDVHLSRLNETYTQTQQKIAALENKVKTANIDSFMKNSADIIAELETLSIDINAIFEQADDNLWKQYYDGNHSAFVKYLAKNISRKEVIAIRENFENKVDFRILVEKYFDDFESVLEAAKNNSRAATLLAVISGSDIGKVYYILARALGKIN